MIIMEVGFLLQAEMLPKSKSKKSKSDLLHKNIRTGLVSLVILGFEYNPNRTEIRTRIRKYLELVK